jgi:hypothetical protein
MKVIFLTLFILLVLNVSSQNNDPAKSRQRDTVSNLQYTWNGGNVTYKEMRDSLDNLYLRFYDSLKKDEDLKRKGNK